MPEARCGPQQREYLMGDRAADPEFAEAYRAELNDLEDLAGSIGRRYGLSGPLVDEFLPARPTVAGYRVALMHEGAQLGADRARAVRPLPP